MLGVFTVLGTAGNAHSVRLFSKESCAYPSTGLCYHNYYEVKLSISIKVSSKPPTINLTQLRRNRPLALNVNLRDPPFYMT